MPSLGADMDAGTLVEWKVAPGDRIERGTIVALVETQKATMEIESFVAGEVEAIVVEAGAKVPVGTVLATVRGAGGHASTVVRDPASANLGRLLSRLASHALPVHVTPAARLMLERMASALPLHERLIIRGALVRGLGDRLLGPFRAAASELVPLLCNTATPTVIRGGSATNVIPTELSVDLDGRVLPGISPADLLAELRTLAGGLATFELLSEEPAIAGDPDLSLFSHLSVVLRERDPGCVPIPMLAPGYTDARYISRLGIQTYGFLPMRLPPHIGTELLHAAGERVPAEAIGFGIDCLLDVIDRYRE